MDCNTLRQFRHAVYRCFGRARDALMDLSDALLTQTNARSLAELSLSAFFTRRWPSVYEALQDGKIDRQGLEEVFVQYAPLPDEGERLLVGGDASSILRPQSKTGRDRTYVHASNLPEGSPPVRPGWQYSEVGVLPPKPCSWVYVLDNRRIESEATQGEVMAQQLGELVPLLKRRFTFVGDGYYGSQTFRSQCAQIDCDVLVRFAKNRVLYREPPAQTGKRGPGHPCWHGPPLRVRDLSTHGTPDQSWEGTDEAGHGVRVGCWGPLHFKKARQHPVWLFRVIREGAADTKRDPRTSWFVFWGEDIPTPREVPGLYALRYSLEHGYRVSKQDLLWEQPRLRTPEGFSCWTDIVSLVRNELYLARELAGAQLQPWENKGRDVTPQQVRRAMGRITAELGTPARPCQVRGYSEGWPTGRARTPVTTYKVVYKATEGARKPKKSRRSRRKTATRPP
jgi:hypothetical protein